MRQKAIDSLSNLEKLRPKRNYVIINNDISDNWHRCDISESYDGHNRLMMTHWAREQCTGRFSRDYSHYYFENEKDAFAWKLKWG